MSPRQSRGGIAAQTAAGPGPSPRPPAAQERRRRELAEFLRVRRARLDPGELGLPPRRRRRTPGLRREDVAERAGVSTAWYTSLEQGRPVNPSRAVVTALADALRLSGVDRTYLFTLTGHAPPPAGDILGPDAVLLQALVDHIRAPAYCTDAFTNVLAWNAAACEVFGDYARWPGDRRNLLWLLFEEPGFGERLVDRDEYAARVVRTFRSRSDTYLNDPVAIEMVDVLSRRNPRFKALWETHDVRRADTDTLEAVLPGGRLVLTLVTLQGVTSPAVRFNAYLPANAVTASLLGTGEHGTARRRSRT
jgi:transcriptional regulator with XRE-family HTH domain